MEQEGKNGETSGEDDEEWNDVEGEKVMKSNFCLV
jgi:hypothetical protein